MILHKWSWDFSGSIGTFSSGIRSSHPFLKMDLDKVKNTHNLLTYTRNLLTSPLRMEKTEFFLKVKPKWDSMFLH